MRFDANINVFNVVLVFNALHNAINPASRIVLFDKLSDLIDLLDRNTWASNSHSESVSFLELRSTLFNLKATNDIPFFKQLYKSSTEST
jgi:hypothetical protein